MLGELLVAKANELRILSGNSRVSLLFWRLIAFKAFALADWRLAPRPVSRRNTPRLDNPVPGYLINPIARFLITRLAFLSALSSFPQDWHTNFSCVCRFSGWMWPQAAHSCTNALIVINSNKLSPYYLKYQLLMDFHFLKLFILLLKIFLKIQELFQILINDDKHSPYYWKYWQIFNFLYWLLQMAFNLIINVLLINFIIFNIISEIFENSKD